MVHLHLTLRTDLSKVISMHFVWTFQIIPHVNFEHHITLTAHSEPSDFSCLLFLRFERSSNEPRFASDKLHNVGNVEN